MGHAHIMRTSAPYSAELLKDRRRDSTLCARDARATQGLNQPVKEGRLRFLQFAPRFFQWEETVWIDFWKALHLSRARRPLHFEIVRANLKAIRQISLEGPGVNSLAALLLYPSKIDPIAVRRNSNLFFELRSCPAQQIFARFSFAFGYRPNAIILLSKKRSARVSQQNLQRVVPSSEH